jgi:hypothetical protein
VFPFYADRADVRATKELLRRRSLLERKDPMITRVGYGTSRTTCYKGHMKKKAYCNTCKRERARLYYKNHQQNERDRKRLATRTKTNDERMRNGLEPITYASQETTQEGRVRKNRLPVAINNQQEALLPLECQHKGAILCQPTENGWWSCSSCNHYFSFLTGTLYPVSVPSIGR